MILRYLGFKLSIVVGLALAAGFALYATLSVRQQEKILESLKREEASLLAETIKGSLNHAMVQGEAGREAVREVIRDIGDRPEIERVRIYDAVGRIKFSTEPSEIGRAVDKNAENCVMCHSGDRTRPPEFTAGTGRFFYSPTAGSGRHHRLLGVIDPIRIDEEESCARCHEGTVLGVLDVVVSLEKLDDEIADHRREMILVGLLGIAGIVGAVALLIHLLVHRPVGALVEGTRQVAHLKLDHRLPEGRRDEIGVLAAAFNDMTARLEKARAEIRDFTESLEQKVEEKTAELQAAQLQMLRAEKLAAIGRMASGAAHEINNPLAGIIAFVDQLGSRLSKAPIGPEELETITREAMRCAKIVRRLLDFAREGEFSTVPADLHLALDRALEVAVSAVGLEPGTVVREYSDSMPRVPLDVGRIGQAFQELLANALEAMGGEGTLTLRTTLEAVAGEELDTVRVDIEDTGPGVPTEIQGRLFDPFFTTKTPGSGTGLGLSVAYGIVEGHGGRIVLESSPGEGARFSVFLPLSHSV